MCESDKSSFFEINGSKVWFEKFGTGPHPVLLIPGPIGTGRTDFIELLEGEDELDFDKFTVIAVEAPGWGRSRPPLRKYNLNIYNNDCESFHEVMEELGYEHYSIIGSSEGAKVALLMAAKYPESIHSIVVSGISTTQSIRGLCALLSTQTVDKWEKKRLEPYLKAYRTKDEIQKLWNRFLKFIEFYNQYFPEDIFKDAYGLVKCPVLIFHGDKDEYIEAEQPLNLSKRLLRSKLHRFPNGEHECHRKYPAQFTKLVQEHLLNPDHQITRSKDGVRLFH